MSEHSKLKAEWILWGLHRDYHPEKIRISWGTHAGCRRELAIREKEGWLDLEILHETEKP